MASFISITNTAKSQHVHVNFKGDLQLTLEWTLKHRLLLCGQLGLHVANRGTDADSTSVGASLLTVCSRRWWWGGGLGQRPAISKSDRSIICCNLRPSALVLVSLSVNTA